MNYTQEEILNLYKSRLLNITSQNKALSFRISKSGKDSVDMYFLKDFNFDNFLYGNDKSIKITKKQYIEYKTHSPEFESLNTEEKNRKIEEIKEEFEKIKGKCEKLIKQQESIYKETGNNVLFVVNNFMSGIIPNGQKKIKMYAPLFLIPIAITTNNNGFEIVKKEEDIILNRTPFIAMMKYCKAKFPEITDFYFQKYDKSLKDSIIEKINEEELINLVENKELEKFPTAVSEFKISELFFGINTHIVFSCIPLMSEIYTDYERMNGQINDTGAALLNEEIIDGPTTDEIKRDYESNKSHKKIFAITKLDKSQEFAVYMAQKSNNLVLYGPPGTGKSETILNIISDHLYRDKKILVVSEKKAAINVIYNRLSNLQNLAIMIDSNSYNYNKFKSELMSKLKSSNLGYSEEAKTIAAKNMSNSLKYFDEIHNLLSTEYFGQTLSEWFYINKPHLTNDDENLVFDICKNYNIKKLFNLPAKEFEVFANNAANIDNINLYKKLTHSKYEYEIMKYIFDSGMSPFILKNELKSTRETVSNIKQEIERLSTEKILLLEKFDELINFYEKLTEIQTTKQKAIKEKQTLEEKILVLKSKYSAEEKTIEITDKEIEVQNTIIDNLKKTFSIFEGYIKESISLTEKITNLENELAIIEHDIKSKKKVQTAKESNIKNLEYIFKEKVSEKERLQDSIFKFLNNKNISNLQNEILDLSNQLTEKQLEVSEIIETLAPLEKRRTEINYTIKQLQDEIIEKNTQCIELWDFPISNDLANLKPNVFNEKISKIINEQLDWAIARLENLNNIRNALEQIAYEFNPQIKSIEEKIKNIELEEFPLSDSVEKLKRQIAMMEIPEVFDNSNFRQIKSSVTIKYNIRIEQLTKNIEAEYEKTKELKHVKKEFEIIDINNPTFVNIINNYESLRDDFRKLKQLNQDIFDIFEYLNEKNLLNENSLELLMKIYYYLKISEIDEKFGNSLCKIEHHRNVQNVYIESEDKYLSYAAAEIINIHNSKLKSYDEYSKKEEKELKEFYSELEKKRSRFKMRQFMDKFINMILKNFPILLITPDALSKYVPLEQDMFDVIIFDEASQLLVEKAIPGIYRAKDMIVVGDNKQLQPSQFFKSQSDVEDEIEMFFEDKSGIMEFSPDSIEEKSLLNVAQSRYNAVRLLFHYRSKFSELIQFSNHVFYHGELQLAPNISRKNENKAIKRYFVPDGLFENGTNKKEATQTVNVLHKILREKDPEHTVGIITFNMKQKELLEELIAKRELENKEFQELYLKEYNRIENFEDKSLFVKNIENVQGDERDIIIFAIGYGFNEKGKISTNFGPLSLAGGENRLNVAVTRAKREIHIITSFNPELLNVAESKNDGARIFKSYLEYTKHIAEGQPNFASAVLEQYHINKEKPKTHEMFKNNLEKQIYDELSQYGLIIDTQIGDCGFDVDLAILDPRTNEYVLGIECDGNDYHNSTNAKERDIQRKAFLKSHKWNIYNIWSVLWYKDKQRIIDEILSLINNGKLETSPDYFSFQTITKEYDKISPTKENSTSEDVAEEQIEIEIEESVLKEAIANEDDENNDSSNTTSINNELQNTKETLPGKTKKDTVPKKVIATHKKELSVVGTNYNDRDLAIEEINVGDSVSIKREPNNIHDENAMSVWYKRKKIGYISRFTARTMAPKIDDESIRIKQATVKSILKQSEITNPNMRPHVDLVLEIEELTTEDPLKEEIFELNNEKSQNINSNEDFLIEDNIPASPAIHFERIQERVELTNTGTSNRKRVIEALKPFMEVKISPIFYYNGDLQKIVVSINSLEIGDLPPATERKLKKYFTNNKFKVISAYITEITPISVLNTLNLPQKPISPYVQIYFEIEVYE